ncbi:calcium-independent phospholipase A2-gamma-like [Trichomycterus rosablanca]|uniref:calcium-independent phospholipase A2-gamma-like n=1 Tax=Trichomycterus rosablanca TaxID=2290929 RepID=UPI002F35A842
MWSSTSVDFSVTRPTVQPGAISSAGGIQSPCSMRSYRSYFSHHSSVCTYVQRISLKRSKQRPFRHVNMYTCQKHQAKLWCVQAFRIYSTSSTESYKSEPPIGVYADSKTDFQLRLLQRRVGDSFKHLSRHINVYFKQKGMSVAGGAGQSGIVSGVQDLLTGVQRPELDERTSLKDIDATELKQMHSDESLLTSAYSRLQLFHMSSLVSRFGESYNYVASHINYVFSKNPANQVCTSVSASEDLLRRSRTRSTGISNQRASSKENGPLVTGPARHKAAVIDVDSNDDCSTLEEGYLHFAHHINRYFGAKVADTVKEPLHQSMTTDTQPLPSLSSQEQSSQRPQNSHPLRPKSLFHMSTLSTHFGENYAYMATHINRYFKGSTATEEEMERDPYRGQPEYRITMNKHISFFQHILSTSAIPSFVGSYLGMASKNPTSGDTAPKAMLDKVAVRRKLAEERTQILLGKLDKARTRSFINSCIEELNAHLILHPACKTVVWQEKATTQILKLRRLFWMDRKVQAAIRETLALIGYVDPLKGCGIRVLSIDGGGTRGVVPLQILKQLEARTGKRVYQLFDYICGVSTGAVLSFMLALAHFSLEECEDMYRRFGSDVFKQNPFVGTVKMGWTHSYYSTETWEMILKEKIGNQFLIKTARDERSPKVSAVSAVVNWGTSPKPFIFRNYNHPPGRLSRYAGGSGYQLWQAVRASSAAPGYFREFPLYNDIHQDGGIILNNPCALAVHESRLLWPNQPFQCVLSLGTGRYDNAKRGPATSTSLRAKLSNLISSATDTEGVHTLIADLLEPDVYFRFNPMLSAEVSLDESRPGALQQLQQDTQHYLERNELKLELLCRVLSEERTALRKTRDWISEKAWELQQRMV